MTVLKTETAVFSRNTDRNRPSSDDPEPLQHYQIQNWNHDANSIVGIAVKFWLQYS